MKEKINSLVSLSLLLLNSCASFQAVSTAELESRNLIGEWHSTSGSRLNIYCSGALSYEFRGVNPWIGDTKSTCSACTVSAIQADQLILGPMITSELKVSRWPYKDGSITKMEVENDTWVKEVSKSCE